MKQVWQAKNGDIFESEEACRDFEEKFYAATGAKYIQDGEFFEPSCIEEEESLMETAQYIFVPEECYDEVVDKLSERGFVYPSGAGIFEWNSAKEKWDDLKEKRKKIVFQLKEYENVIQKFNEGE